MLAGDPSRLPAAEFPERPRAARPLRVEADAEQLDRGLARLVLAILELVRQLLERQAVRRMEGGSLREEEEERLGRALQLLKQKLTELQEELDVDRSELDPVLGKIGTLFGDAERNQKSE